MTARTPIYAPGVMRVQLRPFAKRRARQWMRPNVLRTPPKREGVGVGMVTPIPDPHRYAQNVLAVLLLGIDPTEAEGVDPYAL